jgi:molybdopterin-containing oxidoreductase family iron-sulfur binding subunit
VDIAIGDRKLRAPAWVTPAQADASVTLPLGYGRSRAGAIGNGVGIDAYHLRTHAEPWSAGGARVTKAPGRHEFATTRTMRAWKAASSPARRACPH